MKSLPATVKKVRTTAHTATQIALVSACNTAITADAVQGTWQVIDQLAAAAQGGKTYVGPQSPVSDAVAGQSVCRVTRSHAAPATVAPFSASLALFQQP